MPLTVSFPNFIPGTTIFSSQVNTNNADIENWANAHELSTTGVHGVGAGAIVGTTLSQVLSNKIFSDNLVWLSGASFQGILDHANTATRTYTFPDASGTVVLSPSIGLTIDTSQIISGILPVIRGGTGTNSSTGTGSVVLNNAPTFTGTTTAGAMSTGAITASFVTAGGVDASGGIVAATTFIGAGEILLGNIDPPTANYGNRNSFAKAWASISDTGVILSSYNISSVTALGPPATWQINFSTAFNSTNYAAIVSSSDAASGTALPVITIKNTGSVVVITHFVTTGALHAIGFDLVIFGDQ